MGSPELFLVGLYDCGLVALSVVIAVLASYAALDLAGRVTSARGGPALRRLSEVLPLPHSPVLRHFVYYRDLGAYGFRQIKPMPKAPARGVG